MRVAARTLWVTVLALLGAVLLGLSSTAATVLQLAATTALIMGGTRHPLSVPPDTQDFVNSYVAGAQNNYLAPSGLCGTGCTPVAVITPEQAIPDFGTMTLDQSVAQGVANLDLCVQGSANCLTNPAVPGTTNPPLAGPFVIYGYSQSAEVATFEKRNLAAQHNPPAASFFLLENLNRPNGGILERFQGASIPFFGVTFSGATPTNTAFRTIDVSRQYDALSDFPTNPLNLLSDLNAGAGYSYLHGAAPSLTLGDAVLQDTFGDTTYYLIPTNRLPLLMPLAQLGVPDPILAVVDAPLRVLVEAGYNRTISPGQPTPANFFYIPNPIALVVDLAVSVPTGVDDGLSEVGVGRPLGTQPAGPYGVGGPPVTLDPPPGPASTSVASTGAASTGAASTSGSTSSTSTSESTPSATTPHVFAPTANAGTSPVNTGPPPTITGTSTTSTPITNTLTPSVSTLTTKTNTAPPPANGGSMGLTSGSTGLTGSSTGQTGSSSSGSSGHAGH
jgi:PE-PPE domain